MSTEISNTERHSPTYLVRIIDSTNGRNVIVREIGPYASERTAERAEDGVNRNLNHDQFYTDVVAIEPGSHRV